MSSATINSLNRKNTLGPGAFKDICENIAIARARRAEYYARVFGSRNWTENTGPKLAGSKDLSEILTAARARRADYFGQLVRAWYRRHLSARGE